MGLSMAVFYFFLASFRSNLCNILNNILCNILIDIEYVKLTFSEFCLCGCLVYFFLIISFFVGLYVVPFINALSQRPERAKYHSVGQRPTIIDCK
jgi:hypothetical protein